MNDEHKRKECQRCATLKKIGIESCEEAAKLFLKTFGDSEIGEVVQRVQSDESMSDEDRDDVLSLLASMHVEILLSLAAKIAIDTFGMPVSRFASLAGKALEAWLRKRAEENLEAAARSNSKGN